MWKSWRESTARAQMRRWETAVLKDRLREGSGAEGEERRKPTVFQLQATFKYPNQNYLLYDADRAPE